MENKDGFNFTYSSKQQEEIKRIREKYEAPKEDQMSRLIFLDRSATKKAASAGLTLGIIGTLLLGFGMSLIMSLNGSTFFSTTRAHRRDRTVQFVL